MNKLKPWFSSYIIFAMLLGLSNWGFAANENSKYPSLSMHGEIYSNACDENERNVIRKSLFAQPLKNPIEVWEMIEVILCASPDDTYRKYVMGLIPGEVKKVVESTGSKSKTKKVKVKDEIIREVMARQHAWNASVEVESNNVVLQYFANEACVKTTKIRYVRGKWGIYELGEACD